MAPPRTLLPFPVYASNVRFHWELTFRFSWRQAFERARLKFCAQAASEGLEKSGIGSIRFVSDTIFWIWRQIMDHLPLHFALSEALIVVAAIYAVAQTWRVDRWLAVGLAAIAVAAFVAVIRIAARMTGDIVILHEFLSQYGTIFGLGCIFGALLGWSAWLPPVLGAVAAALSMTFPEVHPLLLAALILVGAALVYRNTADRKFLAAGSFAFLLLAGLASMPFRADYPALGWHIFHTLVAVWYVLVVAFVLGSFSMRSQGVSS